MLGRAVFYYQEAEAQHLAPPAGLSLELLVDKHLTAQKLRSSLGFILAG